jgi:ubiquinone/menaquinone biosynthesis C-methylase UbiE
MKPQILTRSFEVEAGWNSQYDRLAVRFAKSLRNRRRKIAEVGCGSGRLTVPLMKMLTNAHFVLVDRFADTKTGSYSKSHKMLRTNLEKAKLVRRVHVVVSDYRKWIHTQQDGAYDGVISCEFLPEVTMHGMCRFIRECHRVLKPGGVTVHCFWSPTPRNSGQRLVIAADSDATWTRTPPNEWFSPKPVYVTSQLRKAKFTHVSRVTIMSHLVLRGEAAKGELKRWEVRPSFYEKYKKSLDKCGLEFPDWIIISAEKSL